MSWRSAIPTSQSTIVDPTARVWAEEIAGNGPVLAVTAAYTAEDTDRTILADATGGAFSVTLPKAATCKGLILIIKRTNSGANAVTIDGNGSETIDGAATIALSAQYQWRAIQSDGTNWVVVAQDLGTLAADVAALQAAAPPTGEQSVTLGAGDNDNVTLDATTGILLVTANGAGSNLTGLTGGAAGRTLQIFLVAGGTLTIIDQDAGSSAANQFRTSTTFGGAALDQVGESLFVRYGASSNKWFVAYH